MCKKIKRLVKLFKETGLKAGTRSFLNYFKKSRNTDFHLRLNILNCVGKKRIVYVYNHRESSSILKYRVFNIYEAMYYSKKYSVTFFYDNELKYLSKNINKFDVVIFARCKLNDRINTFINRLDLNFTKIGFEIDDYIFDPDIVQNSSNGIKSDDSYLYAKLGKMCSFGVATNEFLAKKMFNFFKFKIYVIPNTINVEQYLVSKESNNLIKENKYFCIGYFSGSPTHREDFEIVSDALFEIMSKYKNVKLKIVGFLDIPKRFLIFKDRIIILPATDMRNLQRLIASVDLNIVPLVYNDFNNCKSELKFNDASISKVPTIASKSYSYNKCIKNLYNGVLSKSKEEWYTNIEKFIKEKNNKIIYNAFVTSMNNYFVGCAFKRIERCFDMILNDKKTNVNIIPFELNWSKALNKKDIRITKFPINIDNHCSNGP